MATMQEAERYVGGGVRRKEDRRLISGQGTFVEGITPTGTLYAVVVRSPYANAQINKIDLAPAKRAPGVVAAFSGAELAEQWNAPLPMAWPVTEDIKIPEHWPLTRDQARYAGDGVAVVVATSRAAAKDAAELVEVDYEQLPAVIDAEAALHNGAPLVHEAFGSNECYTWALSQGDVDAAFAGADVVVKERYVQQRLVPNAIEPRCVVAQAIAGDFTMWSTTQIPHVAKVTLALSTGIPEGKLRVIAPDVGGGFGSKLNVYAEEALCLALARKLRRPIKWIEERSEAYQSTTHGRDVVQVIELAAAKDGKLRGVRVKLVANMGAYLQLVTPGVPLLGAFLYHGCYAADAYSLECTGVFTNTTPTDAYRGAGRPESNYAIERAIERLAREIGTDIVTIRRRNFMPKGELVPSPAGLQFDSVDYAKVLDRSIQMVEYDKLRKEQQVRQQRGDTRLLGVGFSCYVEMCGLAPSQVLGALRYTAGGWDAAIVRMMPTGKVEVVTGTSPHGQGHVTAWSQIAADRLGVDIDDVTVLHGDTAVAPLGMDTYGSRSLAVGGVALHFACGRVIEKAKRLAAHMLEVSPEDLEFENGSFSVRGVPAKAKPIQEVAFAAWTAHSLPEGEEPSLEATYVYDPPNFTFPFGSHICVVEVDTETGKVDIVRYVAVDDCGNVINPMIVDGQVHGGVAQGIAQALYEEAVYDDGGSLLTASMMDYLVPSAAEIPSVELDRTVTPSPTNPMGVKGIGEAGTIAATPAVINAVVDALWHLGVRNIEMPASPERVWQAIRQAKGGRGS